MRALFNDIKASGRQLRSLIKANGGVGAVIQKAQRISASDGFLGLCRRIFRTLQRTRGSGRPYSEWVATFDTLGDEARRMIRKRIAGLPRRPRISIVMPVYNTPEQWLRKAIDSVCGQLYPDWELCIADDASTTPHVAIVLDEYARKDWRIKVVRRATNGHISAASNSALELATGDFTGLLDHDDELAEHALFCVVEAMLANPEAGLIYSDEDKIDAHGVRSQPYFKPDWNYDLLLSHNLICHFACYRTELLRHVGGFREGFEGAQDYDLALRCIEQLQPAQIVHIPRVLYHWRMHSDSTAADIETKPYAVEAAKRAVAEHLARKHVDAEVTPAPEAPAMLRVRYAIPVPHPRVTLIIPSRNRVELLRTCVETLFARTAYDAFDVIVVDNASDEPEALEYLAALAGRERVRVIRDAGNFNFSRLNNLAARHAGGEILGLLNNDLEFQDPAWLAEMVSHVVRPGVGAVGARLWYPNGRLQHGGVVLGLGGVAGHAHKMCRRGDTGHNRRAVLIQNFSAVTAACLLVRKAVFCEVAGLDEQLAVAYNDVDFCLRVRERGYRNIWTPFAEVVHHESASRGIGLTPEAVARFAGEISFMKERWGEALLSDPAYNPNLTLAFENFQIAWPPRVAPLVALAAADGA